jgi:hypothetical protein
MLSADISGPMALRKSNSLFSMRNCGSNTENLISQSKTANSDFWNTHLANEQQIVPQADDRSMVGSVTPPERIPKLRDCERLL